MADPRLAEETAELTVNEELLDAVLRHAHWLERLKTGESNAAISIWNAEIVLALRSVLSERLDNIRFQGREPMPSGVTRLASLESRVRDTIAGAASTAWQAQRASLVEIADMEVDWMRRAIVRAVPTQAQTAGALSVALDSAGETTAARRIVIERPASSAIRAIVTQRPAQGESLQRWWKGLGESTIQAVNRAIRTGLVDGQSSDVIVRSVIGTRAQKYADGVLQTSRRNADALVRTAITHTSALAREATFAENRELIKQVLWVSTLDSRTTDICMGLDGKVFPINEGPRPPAHFQCRSTTVPVLRSLAELGLGTSTRAVPTGTRASFNGQVPASITYPDFLRRQTRAFQDEALGRSRADVFRRGTVPIDRFVDDRGRSLTVRELLDLESRLSRAAG